MLLYLNQLMRHLSASFVFEKSSDKIMLVLSDSTLKTYHFHINKARIIYSTTPLILNQAFTWTKRVAKP